MKCLVQTLPAAVQLKFWRLKQREEIQTYQQTAAISKKEHMKENARCKQCTIGKDTKKKYEMKTMLNLFAYITTLGFHRKNA